MEHVRVGWIDFRSGVSHFVIRRHINITFQGQLLLHTELKSVDLPICIVSLVKNYSDHLVDLRFTEPIGPYRPMIILKHLKITKMYALPILFGNIICHGAHDGAYPIPPLWILLHFWSFYFFHFQIPMIRPCVLAYAQRRAWV